MKQSIKSKVEAAPLFLQKIYSMFEDAPSRVAGWANKGTTIVIKEPEEFAKAILPQYFKHSNFSSFVRQLNFYGFRKFKKDDILIHEHDLTKHWWEFRHEKFLRHSPELMAQIRRKTYSDTPENDSNDVDALKAQVRVMQSQFESLTTQIKSLSDIVSDLVNTRKRSFLPEDSEDDDLVILDEHKRIKLEDLPMATPVLTQENSLMADQLDDVQFDDSTLDPAAWLDGLDFFQPQQALNQRCSNGSLGPLTFHIALKPQKSL